MSSRRHSSFLVLQGSYPSYLVHAKVRVYLILFLFNYFIIHNLRKKIDYLIVIRYEYLNHKSPQLLRFSATVSEKDIRGLVGQNIIKDIKEKSEVRFGSRVFLARCRENSTRVLSYNCDETTLRFDPGSNMKAIIASRNNPTCRLG